MRALSIKLLADELLVSNVLEVEVVKKVVGVVIDLGIEEELGALEDFVSVGFTLVRAEVEEEIILGDSELLVEIGKIENSWEVVVFGICYYILVIIYRTIPPNIISNPDSQSFRRRSMGSSGCKR